jgi:hypothetical protein
MNSEQSNLRQRQQAEQEQTVSEAQSSTQAQGKEFATVEDLLRYDSDQNPVPGEVAERLGQSLDAEPKPPQPWYRRLFG